MVFLWFSYGFPMVFGQHSDVISSPEVFARSAATKAATNAAVCGARAFASPWVVGSLDSFFWRVGDMAMATKYPKHGDQ